MPTLPLPDGTRGFDFPRKLQLQTQNLCNYACGMCPYPDGDAGRLKARLADDVLDRILAELDARDRSIELCLMLQNEPLLDPRFVELVARAHASPRVRSIATVTNGSVLTAAMLDQLVAFERFALTVSVNATDRHRYLHVHGRDRWDRVHDLLATWGGDRGRVTVSCVAGSDDVAAATAFDRYWRGLGYRVRLLPLNERAGTKPSADALHAVSDHGHCRYPVDTLTVLADGRVILCCQDWKHDETFGDLRTQSIAEIWNDPRLVKVRRAALAGELRDVPSCRGCDFPMRSSERVRIERMLRGEPPPSMVPGRTLPHGTALQIGGRAVPVVVQRASDDGEAIVFTQDELAADDAAELVLRIAYGNDAANAIPCRAAVAPVEAPAGLRGYRVRVDQDDPRAAYWRWYVDDWRVAGSVP